MRLWAILSVCAAFAWAIPTPVAAEPDHNPPIEPRVPRAAARVVATYDFEETNNPLPVPRGWARGQSDPAAGIDRPGFPVWNGAAFDKQSPATSGRATVRLPVEGGSASLRTMPGIIPIFPSADYTVSASVRTAPEMRFARAVLAARQLDDRGNPIPGSEVRTPPTSTYGAWRRLAVNVLAEDPAAAFLQVELLVLQPEQRAAGAPRRPFEVWEEDYHGAAWFDDVLVVQRPRLDLTTEHPGNIVIAPGVPVLHVGVRDLAGEELTVRLAVHDLDGTELDRRTLELGGGRLTSDWRPALHAYGWHRATLEVDADGLPIARETCDFLWLPPHAAQAQGRPKFERTRAGRHRFALRAGPMPAPTREQIPGITRALGAGSITLPVWSATPEEDPRDAVRVLTGITETLHADLTDITLEIPEMPAHVAAAAGVDPSDVAGTIRSERAVWSAALDPFFDRFGQRVRRWQVGALETGWQSRDGAFGPDLNEVATALGSLVPGPIVAVPWAWDALPDPALADHPTATIIEIDPGIDAGGADEIVRSWTGGVLPARQGDGISDPHELTLVLDSPKASPHGRWGAAAFARSLVGAWLALNSDAIQDPSPLRVALDGGWDVRNARRPKLEPTPSAGVWRTLTGVFEGRSLVREIDLLPGARTVLLAPGSEAPSSRGAAMIAWRESGGSDTHDILLGADIRRIDLFGNQQDVQLVTDDPDVAAYHRIELTDEPVIFEGVDAELLAFLASVRLDPGRVATTPGTHRHDLVFENPWSFPLRGRLYLLEPGGHSSGDTPVDRTWVIGPRVTEFSAAGGAEGRVPLSIAFGAAQRTGTRDLVIDFELGGGRAVRAKRTFQLGLDDLRMVAYERTIPGSDGDVLVQVEVTNTSDRAHSMDIVGVAPGQPKARASVVSLEPGRTAKRALMFYGARDALSGGEVIVGLSLLDEPGRLNTPVTVARRAD